MMSLKIQKQQGLSLIELMISITLGMILIAAATSTLLDSQRSYKTSDNVNRAQETGRLAMDILVKHIRLGGYKPYYELGSNLAPALDPRAVNFEICTASSSGSTVACHSQDGTAAADGTTDSLAETAAFSDVIAVEYDVPSAETSQTTNGTTTTVQTDTLCNGTTVTSTTGSPKLNDILITVFSISAATATDNNNSLTCQVFNRETGAAVGTSQRLISGVDAMKFLYGVKNIDGQISYLNASALDKTADVQAVKIALLVSDGLDGVGGIESATRNYNLLGTGQMSFDDSKKRYVYTTTVFLNNSLKGSL